MKNSRFFSLTARVIVFIAVAAGSAGVSFGADELPVLQQGMWEFTRTIMGTGATGKPQTITNQKCMNPSEQWKQQNAMLSKMGCTFSPVKKEGNTYTFAADCSMKSPAGQPVSSRTTTVITVESDSAYSVKISGETNGVKTDETLKAKRTGDCNK